MFNDVIMKVTLRQVDAVISGCFTQKNVTFNGIGCLFSVAQRDIARG